MNNVYGELGTTFATCAVANPRFAAAVVGALVNGLGPDRVVWGTDSVWYGSPQWQIEALRRLEIPDDMMKKQDWKTKLGGADSAVKRRIFGENSARLYKYKIADAYDKLGTDKLAQMKREYEQAAASTITSTTATSASRRPLDSAALPWLETGDASPRFFLGTGTGTGAAAPLWRESQKQERREDHQVDGALHHVGPARAQRDPADDKGQRQQDQILGLQAEHQWQIEQH